MDIEMCSEKHILITDQDIFKLGELADTIVNSTVAKYLPGRTKNLNNLEYKLYKLAGYDQLLAERKKRATINGASCYTTEAYGLSQRGFQRIIHVVVPHSDWNIKSVVATNTKLAECYNNVLVEALAQGSKSIVFPLLGTGKRGFDYRIAIFMMQIGVQNFFNLHPNADIKVIISIVDRAHFKYAEQIYKTIRPFHDNNNFVIDVTSSEDDNERFVNEAQLFEDISRFEEVIGDVKKELPKITADSIEAVCRIFEKQDEKRPTLSSMVTHYISIKGLEIDDVVENSNITKRQFDLIVKTPNHNCKFNSVVGLCVGLGLSLEESIGLLQLARMTFNEDDLADQIIMLGIREHLPYYKINEYLSKRGINYVCVGRTEAEKDREYDRYGV